MIKTKNIHKRGLKMEKITAKELRENFEGNYGIPYKNKEEFISAAEAEYQIHENKNGEIVFSGGDLDFIVTDWKEYDKWA